MAINFSQIMDTLNQASAVDAMSDLNADAHYNSCMRIFPRLGETGNTKDFLAQLQQIP